MTTPAPTPPPWQGGAYSGTIRPRDVPDWLWKANRSSAPAQVVDLYRTYLAQNPTARGNRILFRRYGMTPGNGFKPPATPPTPTTPPPAGPGAPGAPGGPPVSNPPIVPPPGQPPGGAPGARGPLSDLYDVYKSAIPIMARERDDQISAAMAQAGFTGNRYGTAAMKTAGDIGAQTELKQNQLLTSLMFEQGNRDLDRALAATNTSIGLASTQDQIERGKLNTLFDFGKYEQGRQDDLARLAYADWNQNKYGLLPLLIQFANGQSGGQAPTPYSVTQPGTTGAADWLTLLAGLF